MEHDTAFSGNGMIWDIQREVTLESDPRRNQAYIYIYTQYIYIHIYNIYIYINEYKIQYDTDHSRIQGHVQRIKAHTMQD